MHSEGLSYESVVHSSVDKLVFCEENVKQEKLYSPTINFVPKLWITNCYIVECWMVKTFEILFMVK